MYYFHFLGRWKSYNFRSRVFLVLPLFSLFLFSFHYITSNNLLPLRITPCFPHYIRTHITWIYCLHIDVIFYTNFTSFTRYFISWKKTCFLYLIHMLMLTFTYLITFVFVCVLFFREMFGISLPILPCLKKAWKKRYKLTHHHIHRTAHIYVSHFVTVHIEFYISCGRSVRAITNAKVISQ